MYEMPERGLLPGSIYTVPCMSTDATYSLPTVSNSKTAGDELLHYRDGFLNDTHDGKNNIHQRVGGNCHSMLSIFMKNEHFN